MNLKNAMERVQRKRRRAQHEKFTRKSEALRGSIGILDEILDERDGVEYESDCAEVVVA